METKKSQNKNSTADFYLPEDNLWITYFAIGIFIVVLNICVWYLPGAYTLTSQNTYGNEVRPTVQPNEAAGGISNGSTFFNKQ